MFHVLAHVPPGPKNPYAAATCSFEPRYVQWAERTFAAAVVQPAAEHAQLTASLVRRASDADVARLACLPFLCRDLAALEALGGRALSELEAQPGVDAGLLESLRGARSELLELVWCAVLLCRAPWAEVHAAHVVPVLDAEIPGAEKAVAEVAPLAPALSTRMVAVSFVLGGRGRGYGDQVLVGAPLPWNERLPHSFAAIALHEHAVSVAHDVAVPDLDPAEAHRIAESLAVAAVRSRVENHPLSVGYESWLARLDLTSLDPRPDPAALATVLRLL